ncbi:methyltransferase domain-containing protein [Kangiella spongicola]|uniref:SAM-dependent methyltransferase n=1 Tax=Kangiella spongicola TaxID=796379 RepID=A0A318D340_9GAMM|nr:methyltransferase domain-containing protein [Kangiella spongicola]PXF63712.1 SAM-dependent methyltransferase [Kangiella spongicola]
MERLFELSWAKMPAGNRLRYLWQEWLQQHLEEYHGGCLLTLDSLTQSLSLPSNVFEYHVRLGDGLCHTVEARPDELPIMTDSIQTVVLSNALEYAQNPSVLLGEVHRALAPQGVLYALLYAPYNPWMLKARGRLSRNKKELPSHSISIHRYQEWLNLLGFKTLETEIVGCPWWRGFKKFEAKSSMPNAWLSAPIAYMVKAQKKVSTMTPLRPLEEEAEALALGGKLANI